MASEISKFENVDDGQTADHCYIYYIYHMCVL